VAIPTARPLAGPGPGKSRASRSLWPPSGINQAKPRRAEGYDGPAGWGSPNGTGAF